MNAVVSVYLYTTKEFLFWIARQVSLVFEYEFFSEEQINGGEVVMYVFFKLNVA